MQSSFCLPLRHPPHHSHLFGGSPTLPHAIMPGEGKKSVGCGKGAGEGRTSSGVGDGVDEVKVRGVGDAELLHCLVVACLQKVTLVGPVPLVAGPAAYLTGVGQHGSSSAHVVEPIWQVRTWYRTRIVNNSHFTRWVATCVFIHCVTVRGCRFALACFHVGVRDAEEALGGVEKERQRQKPASKFKDASVRAGFQ